MVSVAGTIPIALGHAASQSICWIFSKLKSESAATCPLLFTPAKRVYTSETRVYKTLFQKVWISKQHNKTRRLLTSFLLYGQAHVRSV